MYPFRPSFQTNQPMKSTCTAPRVTNARIPLPRMLAPTASLHVILLCYLALGQIIEEATPGTAASHTESECFPPCRTGHVCHKGECIQRCNPPCPEGFVCGDDGECHRLALDGSIQEFNRKLLAINTFEPVVSVDELTQGIVLTTNRPQSVVRIEDTVFQFDSVLYLVTPADDFDLLVGGRAVCPKVASADVDPGQIETIRLDMRPVRISLAGAVGPYVKADEYGVMFSGDAGLTIAGTHFAALSVNGAYNVEDRREYITETEDLVYPDTMTDSYTEMAGAGVTYGYRFLHLRRITLMPRIAIGYWRSVTTCWLEVREDKSSGFDVDDRSRETVAEHYFVKPGVELRAGNKVFGFRAQIYTYIGDSWGPTAVSLGILFRLL